MSTHHAPATKQVRRSSQVSREDSRADLSEQMVRRRFQEHVSQGLVIRMEEDREVLECKLQHVEQVGEGSALKAEHHGLRKWPQVRVKV